MPCSDATEGVKTSNLAGQSGSAYIAYIKYITYNTKEIPFFINFYYLCAPMCLRIDQMLLQGPGNEDYDISDDYKERIYIRGKRPA